MRRSPTVLIALCFIVAAGAVVSARNWPQWRGPQLNGVSAETGLPRAWSPTENIAWKLATPSRTGATPIIWGDRVFLNIATGEFTGDLELWAVDRNKKDVVWKRPVTDRKSVTPNEYMSARPSSGFARACSGAKYCGVPTTMFVPV